MVRVRQRWNDRERIRSTGEITSALGANLWKIAAAAVLELENQDFAIDSYAQRLDVIAEFCAYLVHIVDRLLYARDDPERAAFVGTLAGHLSRTMQHNREDSAGPGDHGGAFIAVLNERAAHYAACRYSLEEGPSFVMRRNFGDCVAAVTGPRNRKWVTDFVMDVQAPAALAQLRRAMPSLFT